MVGAHGRSRSWAVVVGMDVRGRLVVNVHICVRGRLVVLVAGRVAMVVLVAGRVVTIVGVRRRSCLWVVICRCWR